MNCIITLLIIAIIIMLLTDKTMEYFKVNIKKAVKKVVKKAVIETPKPNPTLTPEQILLLQNILYDVKKSTDLKDKYIKIGTALNNKIIKDKLDTISLLEHYNIIKDSSPLSSNPSLPNPLPIPSSDDLESLKNIARENKDRLILTMLTIFDTTVPLDTKIKTINEQIDNLQKDLQSIKGKMETTNINYATINNNLTYLVSIKILSSTTVNEYATIMLKIKGISINV